LIAIKKATRFWMALVAPPAVGENMLFFTFCYLPFICKSINNQITKKKFPEKKSKRK